MMSDDVAACKPELSDALMTSAVEMQGGAYNLMHDVAHKLWLGHSWNAFLEEHPRQKAGAG